MVQYIARRVRFRNGERVSVLKAPNGLPVHEVTLYVDKFRRKGRAANTIHGVCMALALLYRELASNEVDLFARLGAGEFLAIPELDRLASAAQYRVDDLEDEDEGEDNPSVINLARARFRRHSREAPTRRAVDVGTQATRLRCMADFLEFAVTYVSSTLAAPARSELKSASERALAVFRANIPKGSKRAKLNARVGLSTEEADRLLAVVKLDSPDNPWKHEFVRRRNWLIIVLLLATGMRRGELLGLQVGDLAPNQPKLRIVRRADSASDARLKQANTKTGDREIELRHAIMKALWAFIRSDRYAIKAARKIPQVFVSDEGEALSESSIDKLFAELRAACPGLPVRLTSHVMRHTWNDRFSEQAEALGLSDAVEEKARNAQQGWADNSAMAATYTRRHTARKGREVALKLQERLDESLKQNK
ncbi:tyrosine-type recombinase/integrase [Burkholderia thailandensis]|uniref:tyrosine-type recombinase/integrase n=1 Tax=Burkholderia thailandensis TaxID=57975 RepID=UPI0003EC9EB6|nr:site-specific integrase [Burkholderia thailandensis]AHI65528.1 phage integrase family protein [Burkholderia thailandensis H0587]AOJ51990.1 integrase [Burkholderia thailandensis]AVR24337.1 site-specific integrase [Burkholderia thailandensis]